MVYQSAVSMDNISAASTAGQVAVPMDSWKADMSAAPMGYFEVARKAVKMADVSGGTMGPERVAWMAHEMVGKTDVTMEISTASNWVGELAVKSDT